MRAHDWDDERSTRILSNCRRAISPAGRVLILDFVLPDDNSPSIGKWVDLHMLILTQGRERTAAEFDVLLRAAGFTMTRVIPTTAAQSIVEATPA